MAKTFSSLTDLMAYLESQVVVSLEKTASEIKMVLRNNLLNNWYKTYTPQYYERTDMLINSLSIKPVTKNGNVLETEIYFDESKIIPVEASQPGYFPAHMNITDGASEYGGMTYGELLPIWIEEGQHSKIHSFLGIHMVSDTKEWAEEDHYLRNRIKEILQSKGFTVI